MRLWEYGVGDTVRQPTFAHLRRVGPNTYALSANVELTVALAGTGIEISPDNQTWAALPFTREGAKAAAALHTDQLGKSGTIFLRVTP